MVCLYSVCPTCSSHTLSDVCREVVVGYFKDEEEVGGSGAFSVAADALPVFKIPVCFFFLSGSQLSLRRFWLFYVFLLFS